MITAEAVLTPRKRRIAFVTATAVSCLTVLDLSKINVALPSVESSLGGTSTDLQLIVAGYVLVFGIVLVPAGRLGDLTSRRRIFLIGLAGFAFTSVLCAIAPTASLLLAARLLQGVAAGFITPQVIGLIQQLYAGRDRALAFGYFGGTVGIATTGGPVLGGALLGIDGWIDPWRWLFWMNVPLALLLIPVAALALPRGDRGARRPLDLDPVGVALLGVTVFAAMLPFVLPQDWDPRKWLLLVAAAAFGIAFVSWERRVERRGRQPLLRLELFLIPSYRLGLGVGLSSFAAVAGLVLVITLYLQQGLGYPALLAGIVTSPFAAGSAVSSWFAGRLTFRLGSRAVLLGVLMLLLGTVELLLADLLASPDAVPYAIALGLAVMGAGGGINVAANQTMMLSRVPVEHAGVAASLGQVMQRVGTAVGVSIVSSAFFAVLGSAPAGGDPGAYAEAYRGALYLVVGLMLCAVLFAAVDRSRLAADGSGIDEGGAGVAHIDQTVEGR